MPETEIPEIPIVAPDRRRGCLDYLKSKFVIPAAVLASLGIGTVWYMSSCNKAEQPEQTQENVQQTAPQPVELTAEQKAFYDDLSVINTALVNMKPEGYSRQELIDAVIPGYENLKKIKGEVKDAPEKIRMRFDEVMGSYKQVVDDAFDASELYGYLGCRAHKGAMAERINFGGVYKLFIANGDKVSDLEDIFTEEMKIRLLEKSQEKWTPCKQRKRNGRYFLSREEVLDRSVETTADNFGKVLEAVDGNIGEKNNSQCDSVDRATWAALNNNSNEFDAEVYKNGPHIRFRLIYNGHSED